MKKIALVAVALVVAAMPVASLSAQTEVDLDPEFGGRLSLQVDKKLAKGLRLRLEEEVRVDNNFKVFDRFHTTVGITYKAHPNIKLGFGYAMVNPYSTKNSAFKAARHRLMLDATGSLRFGAWRLSLKERFQATCQSGDINEYQQPRTALTLKSRLKVAYRGWKQWEPYAYMELRNTFNAPAIKANYDGTHYLTDAMSQYGEAGWFIDGFSQAYVNRLRGSLGASYRVDRHSSIDIALLADYVADKVVDANSGGTRLKSYTRETGFAGWLAAGYTYSF